MPVVRLRYIFFSLFILPKLYKKIKMNPFRKNVSNHKIKVKFPGTFEDMIAISTMGRGAEKTDKEQMSNQQFFSIQS